MTSRRSKIQKNGLLAGLMLVAMDGVVTAWRLLDCGDGRRHGYGTVRRRRHSQPRHDFNANDKSTHVKPLAVDTCTVGPGSGVGPGRVEERSGRLPEIKFH